MKGLQWHHPASYAFQGCDRAVSQKERNNVLCIRQREFLLGLELTKGVLETLKKAF